MKGLITKTIISICALFLVIGHFCVTQSHDKNKRSYNVSGNHGIVSSAHPLATNAGIEILTDGGNAFDAAVTIALTLNVVEPAMSGMGGYGTILLYEAKTDKIRFLDSSGKIPRKTNSDLMRSPVKDFKKNRLGAKSVSTPGVVNALFFLSSEYGNMEWNDLFSLPVKLARKGFKVDHGLASAIQYSWNSFPDHAKKIYGKNGKPISAGDILIQTNLANTLYLISKKGAQIFYRGKIAITIAKAIKENKGFLTIDDLAADKAELWDPISINYKGYEIFTSAPPSTAFPSLIRLGIMSRFDSLELKHNSSNYLHIFSEATKHSYWCRLKYAGDPEIKPPPLDMLLSEQYWNTVARNINSEQAICFDPPYKTENTDQQHTTHFVVADRWGNIVCATQTLGTLFGSKVMPESTGLWLNNSLAFCTFEPKGNPMDANPGQRKLSGDCPTIILKDGLPWVALGTPGGRTIGQTVPQMIMNLIDFNMDLQEAIDAPRVSFFEPDNIGIEWGINEEVFQSLKAKGHKTIRVYSLGNAHALMVIRDKYGNITGYSGASDVRGSGLARSY